MQQAPPDASQAPPDPSQDPSQGQPAPQEDTGQPGTDASAPTTPTLASSGIDPDKLKEAIHKSSILDAALSAILSKSTGGKVSRSDVINAMVQIVAQGVMSPVSAAGFMADIPEDPSALREWVQRHADQTQMALGQMIYAQHGSEAADQTGATQPTEGMPTPDQGGAPPTPAAAEVTPPDMTAPDDQQQQQVA
jgi:hypothetical protein